MPLTRIEGKTKPIIRFTDDGLSTRISPATGMIPALGDLDYATQRTGLKAETIAVGEEESPTLPSGAWYGPCTPSRVRRERWLNQAAADTEICPTRWLR